MDQRLSGREVDFVEDLDAVLTDGDDLLFRPRAPGVVRGSLHERTIAGGVGNSVAVGIARLLLAVRRRARSRLSLGGGKQIGRLGTDQRLACRRFRGPEERGNSLLLLLLLALGPLLGDLRHQLLEARLGTGVALRWRAERGGVAERQDAAQRGRAEPVVEPGASGQVRGNDRSGA